MRIVFLSDFKRFCVLSTFISFTYKTRLNQSYSILLFLALCIYKCAAFVFSLCLALFCALSRHF